MEYQVPQFIEVESKIVGPLTLKQFIYIAGAAGLCVVFFAYLQIVIALLLSALVIAFAAALAFYKVNNKPFIAILEAGFNYYTGAKFFLWKHAEPNKGERSATAAAAAAVEASQNVPRGTPKLTRGKLSELAWSLDIKNPESETQNQE
ncbi:MAG: PrgI family protein [Candidatus Kaiserbacteria bacterium]|nr:PrgI family protein [Candidatus Kaiserbacteria bacterium]